jgi:ribosome-binding protein aMBF1 (putative translation factor)
MLALVKKPHIELSLQGDNIEELLAWIKKKYDVAILSADDEDSVPVEETDFWKEMEANRIGNLLAAARLKVGLTQAELAEKLGLRQNMISDYERGRRRLSSAMAARFSKVLNIKQERLRY